jgi:hypothetical protein
MMKRRDVRPLLLVLLTATAACAGSAAQVRNDAARIPEDHGVAIGRLGFVTQRRVSVERLQLTAVRVPSGEQFRIPFAASADGGGAFFVSLPKGTYRLTKWTAAAADKEFGEDDTGLAFEVVGGEVACLGAVYVKLRERQFTLESVAANDATVRDECEALGDLLHQHAPKLTSAPVTRLAKLVTRRPAG